MIVKELRRNRDIKWIVIHNTSNIDARAGSAINSNYNNSGYFGAPYDILINMDGTIDLSAQWTYSSNSSGITKNVQYTAITKYDTHYFSGSGESYEYRKHAIHIALCGNFDVVAPAFIQINKLVSVLSYITSFYNIDPRMYLYYHSDFVNTSCPGSNMIPKQQLLSMLSKVTLSHMHMPVPPSSYIFIVQNNSVNVVVNPNILNFVGNNVEVTFSGNTATITYTFNGYIPPVPPVPPTPVVIVDTSLDVTVDAVCV